MSTEFLYKILFFDDSTNIQRLCAIYDRNKRLGAFTRRIQLSRGFAGRRRPVADLEDSLVPLIGHCRKLEIFVIEGPLGTSIGPIADALCTYSAKSLRTVHINVHAEHLARVIWMLDLLPSLVSLHVEFGGRPSESAPLGAASGLVLVLPMLQQLSLRGFFTDFLEEATSWRFPSLNTLLVDFLNYRDDSPDIMEFVEAHGENLTYLDINTVTPLDVSSLLDRCPLLHTFCFNPDWKLPLDRTSLQGASAPVNRPHPNITTIGCHQLLYAFGVGYAATYASVDPLSTHLIRRTNDMNFAALTRENFPKLQRIRILSRMLLRDLETADGPDSACYERWERWWDQCARQGVRLEDCTGAELGTLPEKEMDEEESVIEQEPTKDTFTVIRELMLECRRLTSLPNHLDAHLPTSY